MGLQKIEFNDALEIIKADQQLMLRQLKELGSEPVGKSFSCFRCGSKSHMSIKNINNIWWCKCWNLDESFTNVDLRILISNGDLDSSSDVFKAVVDLLEPIGYTLHQLDNVTKSQIEDYEKMRTTFKDQLDKHIDVMLDDKVQDIFVEEKDEDEAELEFCQLLMDTNNAKSDYEKLSEDFIGLTTPSIREQLELDNEDKWHIEGLMPQGCLILTVAAPKVGKTSFSYKMFVSATNGEDFMGHTVSKNLRCAYFLLDGKFNNLKKRFGYPHNDYAHMVDNKRIGWDYIQPRLKKMIQKYEWDIVFIDCYYRLTDDITDGRKAMSITEPLSVIAEETGCTINLIHHTNRDSMASSSRHKVAGSDNLNRLMDGMLLLEPTMTEQEELDHCNKFDVRFPPQRFTVYKSQFRVPPTQGYMKYTCELDDFTGELHHDKFEPNVAQSNIRKEDNLQAIHNHCVDILSELDNWDRQELLVRLVGRMPHLTMSTSETYLKEIMPRLLKNKTITKVGRTYKINKTTIIESEHFTVSD